ncbi:interferon-induced helicase C domain-containing protein 1-like [Mytilus edulis]|uniref:interferon-induced helicase C domain-containing protein 1-like n=1 Tax=Mytilus edulis TaxID=6550 RepID=UPI0039F1227C
MENDLRERIKFLLPEFQKFLKPTDVLFNIQGLSVELQEKVRENEKRSRTEAVAILINAVSVNENLTEKFVVALSDGGYQRFIDLINKEYPDRGDKFCQDYYEFLICYMKGDLLERIEPLDVCGVLYQNKCIELSDMETIRSEYYSNGKFQAVQELFFLMQRRRPDWPSLFLEALKESGREDLKAKMDPGATPEELERTGVTVGSQQNEDVESLVMTAKSTDLSLDINEGEYIDRVETKIESPKAEVITPNSDKMFSLSMDNDEGSSVDGPSENGTRACAGISMACLTMAPRHRSNILRHRQMTRPIVKLSCAIVKLSSAIVQNFIIFCSPTPFF